MALNKTQVSELFVSIFGRSSEGSGNKFWQQSADAKAAANDMLETAAAKAYFGTSLDSNQAFVEHIYKNTLNKTYAQDQDGIDFWVSALNAGASRGEIVASLVAAVADYASSTDPVTKAAYDQFNNRVEVSDYVAGKIENVPANGDLTVFQDYNNNVTSDVKTKNAQISKVDADVAAANKGKTYELTSGTDKGDAFVGTDKNDFFDASIAQNSFTGGVSNTLSSADKLDGGAGTDTLHAEIVAEFVGATSGDYQIDVQPQTKDIEIVTFEARDAGGNIDTNTTVTVDAKYMYGVEKIGSKFSDGDLIIENLTTLADNGTTIRNTSDMTITMDHTDDTDSDGHASNLTVLFDEDYLVTGQETADASLKIILINAVQNVKGDNPVEGFSEISFYVGEKLVTVDITSVANDASLDYTTAYDAIVDLINAKLTAEGLTSVSASISTPSEAVFSIPVAGYNAGSSAGLYYPITVTNKGSEPLTKGNIETYALNYDTDLNNSFTTTAPVTVDTALSVNIELEKVGRDGEGGNLIIGGKGLNSENAGNTDVDGTDGINQFNITVKGDVNKPSNLGVIQSTNDKLDTVKIVSETRTDNSYAALTVRGQAATDVFNTDGARPFGGTLELLDADGFKGDLRIGEVKAAANIDTFTAMGGGDIYLEQEIFAGDDIADTDEFESLDANEFTIDTGAGNDQIIVNVTDGAQLDVNTGAGDDEIKVNIFGDDDSDSTETFATIISGDGNDEVTVTSIDPADGTTVSSTNDALIYTGAGNDTINGNSVNITVEAGSGNDTIYAENTAKNVDGTAAKAEIEVLAEDVATLLDEQTIAGHKNTNVINETELLYGRTVTVTLATLGLADASEYERGFESAAISIVASNGYLTTELDLYTAIAKAINDDSVLNKLAKASIDSNGHLTVKYLVDGALTDATPDLGIEYTISAPSYDVDSTTIVGITNALKEKFQDSGISATTVKTAYDNIGVGADTDDLTDTFDITTDGANSEDNTDNVINGGLGDDVIVLSTSDESNDTIVIDGLFGNDTIVHFTAGDADANDDYDLLDFTGVLNGQFFAGTSTSADSKNHFDNKLTTDSDLSFNEIIVFDNTAFTYTATDTWAGLTGNKLLAAIQNTNTTGAADYAGIDKDTLDLDTLTNINTEIAGLTFANSTLVGTTVKNIVMIENDLNLGEYKVFELTGTVGATSEFTSATLLGTLDFGTTQSFDVDNFIA